MTQRDTKLASSAQRTKPSGRVVCSSGEEAGGYNAKTGNAWKSEKNQAGVATRQTSGGGKAKTKNGKGVYKSPNGRDCYKTWISHPQRPKSSS